MTPPQLQLLQCVFAALPGGVASASVAGIQNLLSQCSSPQRSNTSSNSFQEAEEVAFAAVSQFTNVAGGKQFVSKYLSSILSFSGFSDFLGNFAKIIPNRPATLTDQNGVSQIQFQFSAGSSGYYAVIFLSGNAVGFYPGLLNFQNPIVSIAAPNMPQASTVTINPKQAVALPSFQVQTSFVARLTQSESVSGITRQQTTSKL